MEKFNRPYQRNTKSYVQDDQPYERDTWSYISRNSDINRNSNDIERLVVRTTS